MPRRRKKRSDDDMWDAVEPPWQGTGCITQLTENEKETRVPPKRPIGFRPEKEKAPVKDR